MRTRVPAPETLVADHRAARRGQFNLRLRPADAEALVALAARLDVGPSTLGRLVIEAWLREHPAT